MVFQASSRGERHEEFWNRSALVIAVFKWRTFYLDVSVGIFFVVGELKGGVFIIFEYIAVRVYPEAVLANDFPHVAVVEDRLYCHVSSSYVVSFHIALYPL